MNSKLSAFAGKLAFLAVIAGCGYLGYRMLTVPREEPAQAEELARPVRTMTLSAAGAMTKHHYFGTVQGSQRVNLSFRVSGPLVELPFDMGNSVKKGDLIGKIDPRDFITTPRASFPRRAPNTPKLRIISGATRNSTRKR